MNMKVGPLGAVVRGAALAVGLVIGADSMLSRVGAELTRETKSPQKLAGFDLAKIQEELALRKEREEKDIAVADLIQSTVDGPPKQEDIQRVQNAYSCMRLDFLKLSQKFHKTRIFILSGGEKETGPKVSLSGKVIITEYFAPKQNILASGVIKSIDPDQFSTPDLQQTADKMLNVGIAMDDLFRTWIEDAEKKFNSSPNKGLAANELFSLYFKKIQQLNDLAAYSSEGRFYLLSLDKKLESSPLSPSSTLVEVANHHGAKRPADVQEFLRHLSLLNPTLRGKNIGALEVMLLGDIGKDYAAIPHLYCEFQPKTGTVWMNKSTRRVLEDWNDHRTLGMYMKQYRSMFFLRHVLAKEEGTDWTAHHEKGHELEHILQKYDPEYYAGFKAKLDEAHRRQVANKELITAYAGTSSAEKFAEEFAAYHSTSHLSTLKTLDQGRAFLLIHDSIQRASVILERLEAQLKEKEGKAGFLRPGILFPGFRADFHGNN